VTYISYTIPDSCTNSGYDRTETVTINSSAYDMLLLTKQTILINNNFFLQNIHYHAVKQVKRTRNYL